MLPAQGTCSQKS